MLTTCVGRKSHNTIAEYSAGTIDTVSTVSPMMSSQWNMSWCSIELLQNQPSREEEECRNINTSETPGESEGSVSSEPGSFQTLAGLSGNIIDKEGFIGPLKCLETYSII